MQFVKNAITLLISLVICNFAVADDNKKEGVDFKERLGFHTNTLYWTLLMPNIGLEYDVVHNDSKKTSIMLSGRYNWNSDHKVNASNANRYLFNIMGAKAELRFYFRTKRKGKWQDALKQNKNIKGLYNKFYIHRGLMLSKDNPKSWRAYYIAPYISYDDFSIKLSKTGIQGSATSVGASFGYNTPLYIYNNGSAIDFELGASAGFVYTAYNKFEYNSEDNCYVRTAEKGGHLLPFPMITEIRMGFVYRFKSIKDQITKPSTRRIDELKKMYESFVNYEKIIKPYNDTKDKKYISPDSIALWRKTVEKKNEEIRKINAMYVQADSSELLTELAYAYPFFEIPQNAFSKDIRKMLPNKKISSISELDNKFLNKIVSDYAGIKDEAQNNNKNFAVAIESVETAMLKVYEDSRTSIFLNTGDSVAEISYINYLVGITNRINEQAVLSHNRKYFTGSKSVTNETMSKITRVKYAENDYRRNSGISFLDRADTLYLKNAESYTLKGFNDEIEFRNNIKLMNLKKNYSPLIIETKEEKKMVVNDKNDEKIECNECHFKIDYKNDRNYKKKYVFWTLDGDRVYVWCPKCNNRVFLSQKTKKEISREIEIFKTKEEEEVKEKEKTEQKKEVALPEEKTINNIATQAEDAKVAEEETNQSGN